MTKNTQKNLIALLSQISIDDFEWNREQHELVPVKVQPTLIPNRDGASVLISGEDGKGLVDYYGEFRGGDSYIHPEIEKFCEAHGLLIEWQNPGAIIIDWN